MKTVAIALLTTACGSSSSAKPDGPKSDAQATQTVVNGNLGGAAFTAKDAVWRPVTVNGFDFPGMSTVVSVTTFGNECALQASQTGSPNGRFLVLALGVTDGSGGSAPITGPGTYMVFQGSPPASSKLVEGYFEVDDASCHKSSDSFASAGSVTVTSASDPVQLTFDLTFGSEHVTGSVHATSCAALDPNSTPLGGC
jgi:hypothetical protein